MVRLDDGSVGGLLLKRFRSSLSTQLLLRVLVVACFSSAHCAQGPELGSPRVASDDRSAEFRKLASGKQIPVIAVYEEDASESQRALVFEYYTAFEMPSEHHQIQREVEEIWSELRSSADSMGVDKVYIVPSKRVPKEPPKDEIGVYGIWFYLAQGSDGKWRQEGGFSSP